MQKILSFLKEKGIDALAKASEKMNDKLQDLFNEDLQFELGRIAANTSQQGLENALMATERVSQDLAGNLGIKRAVEELLLDIDTSLKRR